MDIHDVTGIPRITSGASSRCERSGKAAASGSRGDEVNISPEARKTADSERISEKLEDLKRRIKAGLYKPDIRQIALNLINDELAPLL